MTRTALVTRRLELWHVYLVTAIAPLGALAVLPQGTRTLAYDLIALAAVFATAAGIHMFRPKPLAPWLVLLAGRCAFAAGDVALGAADQTAASGARVMPGPADAAYLAGCLLVAIGFAALLLRRSRMPDWHALLDAGIVTTGLGVLVWTVFVDPVLGQPNLTPAGHATVVAYAIANTALSAIVACLLLVPSTAKPVVRLFAGSVGAAIAAEIVVSNFGGESPTYWPGLALQGVSFAFWGAACLHPSVADAPQVVTRREPRLTPRRLASLGAAAFVSPAVLLIAGPGRDPVDYALISAGWIVTILLVLACVAEMVREQDAALAQREVLETQFRDAAELLRAVLDACPLGITVLDRNRHVRFWSRAAQSLYGFTSDEAIGRFPPMVEREQIPDFDHLMERAFTGERVVASDLPRVTKAGVPIKIRVYMVPMRDEHGEVWAVLALHEDMRELKQLEAELFEARKMESVGRLAGGIAHDFNNILTAIIGFTDIALDDPQAGDIVESLSAIKTSAERAAGLTQQLLAFSRRQMLQPQIVDVNKVVLSMEPMLRRLIGEHVSLQIVTSPAAGSVRADPTQLQQVLLNLAINARDAMPDGGELTIKTGRDTIAVDEGGHEMWEVAPGDYVMITVMDTGQGMTEEVKQHIFEPFFTTKAKGRGTGLGLATTYGIVKQSGGSIQVDSAVGMGTTFVLRFPVTAGTAVEVTPETSSPSQHVGRILLVEDEPVLRNLASRVLQRAGFDVLVAADPLQAMAISDERKRDRIDLLLTDVVMPGMRGPELARRLRAQRPGLPVLLTSGYADEIVETDDEMDDPFLAKPFTPDALLHAVEAALPQLAVAS